MFEHLKALRKFVYFLAILAVLTFGSMTALVLPVYAQSSTGANNIFLIPFHGGNAIAKWERVYNIPYGDGFAILLQTNAQTEGGGYAGIDIGNISGTTLGQMNYLGFTVNVTSNAYGHPAFGAGAPRFSIILSNGVVLFADPFYCSDISSTPLNTWAYFDVVTDSTCVVYTSSGGPLTWSQVLTDYGSVPISQLVIIQDDTPATLHIGVVVVGNTWIAEPWMNGLQGSCTSGASFNCQTGTFPQEE